MHEGNGRVEMVLKDFEDWRSMLRDKAAFSHPLTLLGLGLAGAWYRYASSEKVPDLIIAISVSVALALLWWVASARLAARNAPRWTRRSW